jgi:hypothetical protein
MAEVIITISPTAETTVETKGYAGNACKDATREFEKKLGKTTSDKPTAEAYQSGAHLKDRA